MNEAKEFLSQDPLDEDALRDSKKFGKLFGRSNHHFSFIRKSREFDPSLSVSNYDKGQDE